MTARAGGDTSVGSSFHPTPDEENWAGEIARAVDMPCYFHLFSQGHSGHFRTALARYAQSEVSEARSRFWSRLWCVVLIVCFAGLVFWGCAA